MSSDGSAVYQPPRVRLALGLGDQELEQRLRPALDDDEDLQVVAQCLAADQLLGVVESRQADAVVAAFGLHRLTDVVLDQLDRSGLAVVLLVPDPDDQRWRSRHAPVLAVDSDAGTVRQAIMAARRGERVVGHRRSRSEPVVLKAADRPEASTPGIIAIAGGVGSPGRTTVAINLATALGAVVPTALVEADLCAPGMAAYLDRDPSRNVCTLAHAVREDANAWGSALADELQPLSRQSPSGVVLCGLPKREMRTSISPAFVERLIAELARRFRYVVLDVGPELLGTDTAAANHRAALASAQRVLMVTASDLVGLWHARTALDQFERQLGIERQNISLVLNRHDPRHHHSRSEVEWHLGADVAAVVPFDHPATQRAISEQRPLVVDPTSRAGRALVALAERVHDGQVRLPVEQTAGERSDAWWRRAIPGRLTLGRLTLGARRRTPLAEPLGMPQSGGRRGRAW